MEERRVVITGVGVVAPNGIGIDAFWDSLMNLPVNRDYPKRRKKDFENNQDISDADFEGR
ncbi:MAG TPA: beta-ketoacyl synthase N-terminal-like domain-containing protein [Thermodesulfobacteriota bacterium]|nr:beta-ketoacyl synthase N-terminal-like domain-containing protein [Thermodesulfobacteriota bacterium]